jgi:hypothetical protein
VTRTRGSRVSGWAQPRERPHDHAGLGPPGRPRTDRERRPAARRHAELEERLARLEAELHDVRVHAGRADDAIARLTEGLAATSSTFEHDLAEARRLSHRVAQMTDVVFDRLAERSGDQPA